MSLTAVLCVRNEAAFLIDWLAHHMACGVDHFVIASNDCDDGTDEMLDRLAQVAPVTHLPNPGPFGAEGAQFAALKRADQLDVVKRSDWLLALDIDEFVNVHLGDRTLPALMDALPEATAITLTWRLFGNAGIREYTDRPVTEQFTHAAPAVMFWPWRAAMFKTLYRNDGTYRKLGVHRPRGVNDARIDSARWFDGSGRALPDRFLRKRIFSDYGRDNYGMAQLNHYPLGAMESYMLKVDRGRAVHSDQRLGMDYWVERNYCEAKDRSVLALAPKVAEQKARLVSDGALADLHRRAVAWRQQRFEALMQQEPNRALFARLLMTPSSRALPRQVAETMLGYALSDPEHRAAR